jgi:hypothetical protein
VDLVDVMLSARGSLGAETDAIAVSGPRRDNCRNGYLFSQREWIKELLELENKMLNQGIKRWHAGNVRRSAVAKAG